MRDLVTAFIIGASLPAFALFFIGFYSYKDSYNKENCLNTIFGTEPYSAYHAYSLIAPLYIGLMSAIAVYISKLFQIPRITAFVIISVISTIIVSIMITYCKIYTWDQTRLTEQYFILLFYHAILYIIIIATIYEYITSSHY